MLKVGMYLTIVDAKAMRKRHPSYGFLWYGQTFQVYAIGAGSFMCAMRVPGSPPKEHFELGLQDLQYCQQAYTAGFP